MSRVLQRCALALAALAPLLIVLGATSAPAAAAGPTISGTGSSYAAVAINQWASQVESLYGDNVNYSTTSSVIGLDDFAQYPLVDFGASEIGYSTGQADQEPPASTPYQYLPDVAGATCLMYNLEDQLDNQIQTLDLNSAVMADIFDGSITKWNDAAIQALNPTVPLPNSPIIVVYRTDASGDNYIFSDFLQTLQPAVWTAFTSALQAPAGAQAIWPIPQNGARSVGPYDFGNWTGESGSDNASNYVYGNPGSITYVETAYALLHHDPCALVQNASGSYVKPSEVADAVALESDALQPDLEQNLVPVFTSPNQTAYPISAYSYLVMAEQAQIPSAKQAVESQFVQFVACRGQQSAGALGYSPLPPNLVQADFDAVGRITGTPIPAPTASNCANPYVDGQLSLVGEPAIGSAPAAPGSAGAAAAGPTSSTVTVVGKGGTATVVHAGASTGGATASGSSSAAGTTGGGSGTGTGTGTGTTGQTQTQGQADTAHPPPGQIPGLALHDSTDTLLGTQSSGSTALIAAFGFLLLLAVPPLIATRRRRSPTSDDEKDAAT